MGLLEDKAIQSGNVLSGWDFPKIGGPGGVRGHAIKVAK